jgi:hypothetical protein
MSADPGQLARLTRHAAALCGTGSAQKLVALAQRYPDPLVWEQALETVKRNPPHTSALGYLARVLETAAQEQASLSAHVQRHTPAAYPAPPGFVSWGDYELGLYQSRLDAYGPDDPRTAAAARIANIDAHGSASGGQRVKEHST